MNSKSGRLLPGAVFAVFFVVYLSSLPLFSARFQSGLLFGSDDMFAAYNGHPSHNLIEKHPLFIVVMVVYQVGAWLFALAPPDLAHNLRMVFPMALFGAGSVTAGYYAFVRLCNNRETALLFTILYGICASTWFYGSYPETYVLTTFFTNLTLCAILGWPKEPDANRVARSAFLNALACFCSPQQIFVAIVPLLRWPGESVAAFRRHSRRMLVYMLVLALAFLIPYEGYIKIMGKGWRFGQVYLHVYGQVSNLTDLSWILIVAVNFLIFSVIGPPVSPSYFTDPSMAIFRVLPPYWVALALLFLTFCLFSLIGLGQQGDGWPTAVSLLAFLFAYILFFVYFNPSEAFLYVLPALLPWLLLLQIGFVKFTRSRRGMRRVVLYVLICAAMANNLHFRSYLQHLKSNVAAAQFITNQEMCVACVPEGVRIPVGN